MIRIKRVYDEVSAEDGRRWLVDRLWPRGFKKDALQMEVWLKDVAPSLDLCRWFAHKPSKWAGFQQRYLAELAQHPDACKPILEAARDGPVTLLYSARDTEHNNAVALKSYLEVRLKKKSPRKA
jgi:uncharacterized protein YeaO (DUF488 family)